MRLIALLVPLVLGTPCVAQSEAKPVPPEPMAPWAADMIASAEFPTFAGRIAGGWPLRLYVTGPTDILALLTLLDSLDGGSLASRAAEFDVHMVAYSYADLHRWHDVARRRMVGLLLVSMIDVRTNRVQLDFMAGISPEEIDEILDTLEIPRDALFYRDGGVWR